jgi:hypothetical protein
MRFSCDAPGDLSIACMRQLRFVPCRNLLLGPSQKTRTREGRSVRTVSMRDNVNLTIKLAHASAGCVLADRPQAPGRRTVSDGPAGRPGGRTLLYGSGGQ